MFVNNFILLKDVQEVSSNVPFLVLILFILMLPLVFVILKKRIRGNKVSGKKRSVKERLTPTKVKVDFVGERKFRPRNLKLSVENTGSIEVDLNAPVIIFKRWRSVRKFRIKPSGTTDVYPTWLEPGNKYVLNINLEDFYQSEPELRRACRVRIEITDINDKKFKSDFIRLRWL
jgi:hypothetical protein